MFSKKFKELADQKAKVSSLEKQILAERDAQLRSLHVELGYDTREALIAALKAAGPAKRAAKGAGPAKEKKRRKRTKITPELRDQIIAAIKDGGTGSSIAAKFGISLPTVGNVKRAAGLVKQAE